MRFSLPAHFRLSDGTASDVLHPEIKMPQFRYRPNRSRVELVALTVEH